MRLDGAGVDATQRRIDGMPARVLREANAPLSDFAQRAARRHALQRLGALALGAVVPGTRAADSPSPSRIADFCKSPASALQPLFVPGSQGYLGRFAPGAQQLLITAGASGRLPAGVVHGPYGYRISVGGRDFLNPALVVRRGDKLNITLENAIDAPTIVHWHGLGVDTRNDGGGLTLIAPGKRYEYAFDVRDRAGLYWYHPHPHGATAGQVYGGLYGLIEIEDDDERALKRALALTPGKSELALILQDRSAAAIPGAEHRVHGFYGDDLYINGTHCAYHEVATRLYRLRMLNACNARTLRLAFRTASGTRVPFSVIGNDGGLLETPLQAEQVFLATAERIDVLLDLSRASVGETIVMESLAFDAMHAELPSAETPTDAHAGSAGTDANGVDHAAMGHGSPNVADHAHMHSGAWPDGGLRALLLLRVRERVRYDRRIPSTLSRLSPIDVSGARERPFRLGFNKGLWRINDRVFAMGETPIQVPRDAREVWLIRNYHTSMPHAMHLHGFHFAVLERETSPEFVAALAIDDHGRLASDLGRRDTVLVWPGESVRLGIDFAMPFADAQTYMFHCHNLEHEDGGMMLGVRVG